MELDIHTSSAGHHQSFDGTDFQCSAEPSHVTMSMSEKLMNEEVDEVTQQSDVDVGSTRSWTRTGRGGVQEYTSIIHVSSKS